MSADEEWRIIHQHTRAQAIEDGQLVAVPEELAKSFGLAVPVALSIGAWQQAVDVPPHLKHLQDEIGRLKDVLILLARACRMNLRGSRCDFYVLVFDGRRHKRVDLYALIGPGDDPSPVITVMLPGED